MKGPRTLPSDASPSAVPKGRPPPPATVFPADATSSERVASPASVGLFRTHAAANGTELRHHSFDGGDRGLVVYFDGDGTDGFDTPRVGSEESNGADSQVQRIRKAAAAEGFDLIFIDHPGGGESWWNGVATEAVASAVEDLVTATGATRVEFVGYSGGAEFLARHLLAGDASWWPEHVGATMIGGGGASGHTPETPTKAHADANLVWVTGESDSFGTTPFTRWSALNSSHATAAAYSEAGFTWARVDLVPNTAHLDYDFAGITRQQVRNLAEQTGAESGELVDLGTTEK